MTDLLNILQTGNYSLVVQNGGLRTFCSRGVSDLYRLYLQEPEFLKGAQIADKAVGKAAAALMVLGGVSKLQTPLISRPALELLREYPVEVAFGQEVPHIENRNRNGWCPLENLCFSLKTPQECLTAIASFIESQQHRNQTNI